MAKGKAKSTGAWSISEAKFERSGEPVPASFSVTPAETPKPSATPKYDAAMEQRAAGTLRRAVLTEKGWVTPQEKSED